MEPITLIFPDSDLLSDFIIDNQVWHADVSSCECKLTGELSTDLIGIAITDYDANIYQDGALVF